jgi:hypothetical protein
MTLPAESTLLAEFTYELRPVEREAGNSGERCQYRKLLIDYM